MRTKFRRRAPVMVDNVAENLSGIGLSQEKLRAQITPAEPDFLSPKRGDFGKFPTVDFHHIWPHRSFPVVAQR